MPQNAPTVQSVVTDPKFQLLSDVDKISVLSKVDSNFAKLGQDTQLEVMGHLSQVYKLPPTIGADLSRGIEQLPGESTADFNVRLAQREKDLAANPSAGKAASQRQMDIAREALPYAGAAAASLFAGPEAGIATRMGLAALGGAGGSVASHAIPGGNQPPLLSSAGAADVAEDALKQSLFELGGALTGKAVGSITKALTSKVPIEEAASKVADTLSPNLTPAEFGEKLRQTLTIVRQTLGQQKGQALDDITSRFMPTQPNFTSTRLALNDAIQSLEAQRGLTPSLFQAGESKAKTLAVLKDLRESINSGNFEKPGVSVFRGMDNLRTNLFQMGKGMDAPLPKGMVSQLTHAVHDDIGATLHQFGPDGDAAFNRFESTSSNFRQTADILDTSTFKRVMKTNVNQPEKLLNILMQAPETNVENLQTMLRNSSNGPEVLQNMKHLALERAASYPNGLDSIPEPAQKVVFGADLPKVQKFFDLVEAPDNPGMISRMSSTLLGGHAGTLANWVIRSGNQTGTISSTALAALLGNASTRQILMRAAETPASGQAAALLFRALGAYIEAPPAPVQQQPVPAQPQGATIGEQLKSKGIQIPQAPPNAPGLPFHPGAGL